MKKEETPFIINIIQDMANISFLVNTYFNDEKKTTQWLNTENPLLGNQEPVQMIFAGRTEKLKNFIEQQLLGNNS
jgi:hypothetical protein